MHTESLSKRLRKSSFPVSFSDKGSWEGSETELGLGEKPLAVVGPGLQLSAQCGDARRGSHGRAPQITARRSGGMLETAGRMSSAEQCLNAPGKAIAQTRPCGHTKACVYDNRDGGLATGC